MLCKKIKAFTHFVSRDALNIDGFSEATLEKFIDHGWLQKVTDIFSLSQYKEEIQNLDGFGEKSYTNLIQAIEDSKQVTLERVIYSLGIKGLA